MRSSLCTGRAILGRKARYDHVKVKTVFAVIVLAALSAGETAGRLFVHIAPGFEVLVYGVSAGVTSADVGVYVFKLFTANQRVIVRFIEWREGAFHVPIESGY